ncbi:hypothetical protein [Bradyrhizobium sp. 192]|uniref:hypothetical protein n=1 Tax=Bradyrhizobium sp. 192 TaxID=2782660 RepID=UPI001FFF5217|nr:hypothetical protein [Bradyrhizobium sp. 192]UPJ57828.1 hypothetical protein IVB24_35720 [Bradyrhizobium sp. 192]
MATHVLRIWRKACKRSYDWCFHYWKNQYRAFLRYFDIYGGPRALLRSPYVHVAVFLTVGCRLRWSPSVSASDIAVSVIPNLLGFTVGALAIVLAFSSAPIFKMLAQDGDPRSYFMRLTVNLVHFIVVQACALIVGIVGKATASASIDVLALFFLFYGVLITVSAGIQLLQTASLYNQYASLEEQGNRVDQPKESRFSEAHPISEKSSTGVDRETD